ncbi:MAG: hypothetical protein ACI9N9_001201 [Enterobacterales bacterium]|jgi:hypothetical protein
MGYKKMSKQWIYRNGDKPFSVTEIVMPDGSMCFTSVHVQGFLMLHYSNGKVLEVSRDLDLIPYEPYADFKIDDKVYVKDAEHDKNPMPGHFAGLNENGQPTTFLGGCTSFTCSDINSWNFCEKANKEDK